MRMTITEGLAEIKLINKKIENKHKFISNYLGYTNNVSDPLADKGGSKENVARERQAILDLQNRLIDIRTKIQKSNLETGLTICGLTRTVQQWLNWRKEIAQNERAMLDHYIAAISEFKKKVAAVKFQRVSLVDDSQNVSVNEDKPIQPIISFDEKELHERKELLDDVLAKLDGQLSLLNATTFIEIN